MEKVAVAVAAEVKIVAAEKIKTGDIIDATIYSINDTGIWVKFGDYTGIILIVDLQWKRVPINPLDFGEIGGAIKLVVMSVLEDSKKFYGSLKHLHPDDNPWKDENYYRNGMLIGGKPYEKVAYGYRIVLETNAIAILETVDVTKELELGIEYTFRIKDSDPKKQIVWVELGK